MKKLPAYGKDLQSRLKFKNPPFLAVVCVGSSAWNDAKKWKESKDISPLVLTDGQDPARLVWPVEGLNCIVEWSVGPSEHYILSLIKTLFKSEARSVTVRPLFEDRNSADCFYDVGKPVGERWTAFREKTRTYLNPIYREVRHAA